MTLQYVRTTLDGLTDAEKQHYKDKDAKGRYILDVNDAEDERVAGLVRNKNEALAEKESMRKKLADAEAKLASGDGETKDKRIAELEKSLKEGEKGKYTEAAVAQIKSDLDAAYKKQLAERDDKLKGMQDRVAHTQRENAIQTALAEHGAKKGAHGMMVSYLGSRVDVVEAETGGFTVRVKKEDNTGHEVSTKDGSVFMTVSELVGTLKANPDYGFAFDGSKGSGGGAEGNANVGTGTGGTGDGILGKVQARSDLKDSKAKAEWIAAKKAELDGDGPAAQKAYFDLPEERDAAA